MIKQTLATIIVALVVLTSVAVVNAGDHVFRIIHITWGTPTAPLEVGPGDVNVPVTVTLQYTGIPQVIVKSYVLLPKGFTPASGRTIEVFSNPAIVTSGSAFQLQFNVNVGSEVKPGDYNIMMVVEGWLEGSIAYSESLIATISLKGRVSIDIKPDTYTLKPGQVNTINITLENTGTGRASKLSLTFTSQSQIALLNQTIFELSYLEPNTASSVQLHVYVPSSLSSSPVTILATLSYVDEYLNHRTLTRQVSMYVLRPDLAMFSITPSVEELSAGSMNNLQLIVRNNGLTPIYDMSLAVNVQPGIGLMGSDGKWVIGMLKPQEFKVLNLTVYVPPYQAASTVQFTFTVSYYDSSSILKTETRVLSFIINPSSQISPIAVQASPPEISSGTVNNVSILFLNKGSYEVKDLRVTVSIPLAQAVLLNSDGTWSIGSINPDELKEITLSIYPQLTATTSVQVTLSIAYYDEYGTFRQEVRSINLLVRGLVNIELIDVSIAPDKIVSGQPFSVSITVTNTGTIPAYATSAYVKPQQWFKPLGSQTVFIGDLQVNAPTSFTISLIALNTTQLKQKLELTLTYMDNLRRHHSIMFEIPVEYSLEGLKPTKTTPQQPQPVGVSNILIYVALTAISFILGYLIARRKHK